jgi:hypothetical protein
MTVEDDVPTQEPRGDLVPPVRHPPTAVGAGTLSPEPRAPVIVRSEIQHLPPLLALLDHAVTLALDVLDAAGDAVAERLGIRPAAGEPPTSPPPPL